MGRHRKFSPEFKVKVVLEALQGQKSAAQICRENNLAATQLSDWQAEFLTRAPQVFASPSSRSAEQARIAELERLIGQLTLELAILKKASSLLRSDGIGNGSS